MSLKQALAILAANDVAADGTFTHALHERSRFDAPAFWTLWTAMMIITQARPKARGRLARRRAYHVHYYVLLSLLSHFNSRDGHSIRRLPERAVPEYLERLRWVFDPVIEGTAGYSNPLDFDDGLKNPHQAMLERKLRGKRRPSLK